MKTLGLHKKSSLHTWGLGGFTYIVRELWNDAIRFSTYIKRKLNFRVEF